jgi:hypothetical protein
MAKLNCWEFKRCGRQPGGAKAAELGVCPAATETRVNGLNDGKNAGRACWAVAGTLCGGTVQGAYAMKLANCLQCEFYQLVGEQQGPDHESAKAILARLK